MRQSQEKTEKTKKKRITICMIILLVVFAIFTARLADWQIFHGSEYKNLATRSTSYTVETDATRGEIVDKNGVGLVVNTTHYKIVFDKLYIDEKTIDKTILNLIDILSKTGDKWNDTLPLHINADNTFGYNDDSSEEIKALLSSDFLNANKNTTADECINKLKERYKISNGYTNTQLHNIISVHYNMEVTSFSGTKPYEFASDISRNAVSAVSENTQGISGVDVQTYSIRGAQNATLAPHILGALGSITQEEYEEKNKDGKSYELNDKIGKFGIELAYEDELKGTGGTKIVQKNSDGSILNTSQTIDAKPGDTVFLTIDSNIQKAAVKSLETNVKAAKEIGVQEQTAYGSKGYGEDCEAGATVMLSVKDFSVLAAASYPTYDLNKYSEYSDYYVKLSNDKNSPMYNRISIGSFACGSVYKPCVACAALEEKVVAKDEEIFCKQNYDYYPNDVVRCMHYHGDLNITGAITQSCNYYFAEVGRRLGINTMYLYSEKFGLGEYTGLEIEESKGTLAGRDSKTWTDGNTCQAAIGQSDNAFTPIQLATYVATIANNGTRLKTHLVSKVTNYERTKTISENSVNEPKNVDTCGVSDKNLKIVQNAMYDVANNSQGTANYMFGDYKVKIAAKTGTAENAGSDHTTFICYAPYDNPEVAVSVVIEHGTKGKYSMQVAKDMLDAYFASKKAKS